MGLLQPSNVSPSTKAGYGNMAIFSSEQAHIKWQLNGDAALTKYEIKFYKNDAASTFVYQTGQITVSPVVYPQDANGNIVIYDSYTNNAKTWTQLSITPDNSSVTEYKYKITQYWSNGNIEQTDFNVVYCLGTNKGTLALTNSSQSYDIKQVINGSITQTNDYSVYNRVRWQLRNGSNILEDTGTYETIQLKKNVIDYPYIATTLYCYVYNDYGTSIQANISIAARTITTQANMIGTPALNNNGGINLTMAVPTYTYDEYLVISETFEGATKTYTIGIDRNGETYLQADKYDIYSLKNGASYVFDYYRKVREGVNYYTKHDTTKSLCFQNASYTLLEAKPLFVSNNRVKNCFSFIKKWTFKTNINASTITNNNTPAMQENFTGYRLKQPSSRKGKSGTLSALLSNVKYTNGIPDYNDTTILMNELYEASLSGNDFFLLTPKGNFYKVVISQPIQQTINDKTGKRQVSISIGWEEVADASNMVVLTYTAYSY